MISNLFIFLFGHGRSGTSAVRGYLNLSSDINMAFEENLMILQQDNKKVWSTPEQFSFDHELCERTLSPEFNGNKIILGPSFVSAERITEAISRRVVITHSEFDEFKVLFTNRNKEDLIASIADRRGGSEFSEWAKENYEVNEAELEKLKLYYPDHYSFDFYDFLQDEQVRSDIFKYLDLSYSTKWFDQEVDAFGYGIKKLSLSNLKHYSFDEKEEVVVPPKPLKKKPTKTKKKVIKSTKAVKATKPAKSSSKKKKKKEEG